MEKHQNLNLTRMLFALLAKGEFTYLAHDLTIMYHILAEMKRTSKF